MAKLRRAIAWRRIERPYTRKSKYRDKTFIRAAPTNKVIRFDVGDPKKSYDYTLHLISKSDIQIRHNALESARVTANRTLEKELGKMGFYMKIRVYPHHVLRENPIAAGAGADRFSTGMKKSFGKPVGLAAQIKKGQKIFSVSVNKNALKLGKDSLRKAKNKFPCSCIIEVNKNN
jgi:large subunit ribosomal protein L10e